LLVPQITTPDKTPKVGEDGGVVEDDGGGDNGDNDWDDWDDDSDEEDEGQGEGTINGGLGVKCLAIVGILRADRRLVGGGQWWSDVQSYIGAKW
jgi:hypothetical protein